MKVSILLLTCGRPDMTKQSWEHNLHTAGQPCDLYWLDNGSSESDYQEIAAIAKQFDITWHKREETNLGISPGFNQMIVAAFENGADAVMTMANDITEPDGWVQMRCKAAQEIEKTAVVAIPVQGSHRYGKHQRDGSSITIDIGKVIGNYLITRLAYDTIGLFTLDYGKYGPIDLDYCDRCNYAELLCYYLSDEKADHIGHPKVNPPEYQKEKEDSLRRSWQPYTYNVEKYRAFEKLYQNQISHE